MAFVGAMDVAFDENKGETENGDITVKQFKIDNKLNKELGKILSLFSNTVRGTPIYKDINDLLSAEINEITYFTIMLTFYFRSIKYGQGERDIFRIAFLKLWEQGKCKETLKNLIPHIANPNIGYYKDLLNMIKYIINTDDEQEYKDLIDEIHTFMASEFRKNTDKIKNGEQKINIAIAKYMPREGSQYKESATALVKLLYPEDINQKKRWKLYREELAIHSAYFQTVEQQMCAKDWNKIEFGKVPSKAALLYANAFKNETKKHDTRSYDEDRIECAVRYMQYLEDVANGKDKINASAAEITHFPKQFKNAHEDNITAELQFAQYIKDLNALALNTVAVVDVSGSMDCPAGGTKNTCMDMAVLLGIILSQLATGVWKDRMITFHENPSWINTSDCNSFREKFQKVYAADWGGSTNFYKTLMMILDIAVQHKLRQEELPQKLFVFSDMQFDAAEGSKVRKSTFEKAKHEFEKAGYTLPTLVYWNLNFKENGHPVDATTANTVLISGFSPKMIKTVLEGKNINPFSTMFETLLETDGFKTIRDVISSTQEQLVREAKPVEFDIPKIMELKNVILA